MNEKQAAYVSLGLTGGIVFIGGVKHVINKRRQRRQIEQIRQATANALTVFVKQMDEINKEIEREIVNQQFWNIIDAEQFDS